MVALAHSRANDGKGFTRGADAFNTGCVKKPSMWCRYMQLGSWGERIARRHTGGTMLSLKGY